MKFTSIRTDRDGQQHLRCYEAAKFIQRIQRDANNLLISSFREEADTEHPERHRRYHEIPGICAAVELYRQSNGALGMAAFNGLVAVEVHQVMGLQRCEEIKRAAMGMPMTWAAFIGATGREVVILVRVKPTFGSMPASEVEAEAFYAQAYHTVARLYDATLPQRVTRVEPSLRHTFLLPLDPNPLVNELAVPYGIDAAESVDNSQADTEQHLLALPERRHPQEVDLTAYSNYERIYREAAEKVLALGNAMEEGSKTLADANARTAWYEEFTTGMAVELCRRGWPEEETVRHLWRHLKYRDEPGLSEEFIRRIVEAAYAEDEAARRTPRKTIVPEEPVMQQIIRRMESRYCFRHNIVMGYTEFRPNHTIATRWNPVTRQVINTFTTDLLLAGLRLTNHDVQYYVHSTRIHDFNPIHDYLSNCPKWDGRDHIRALARTVPTQNARQWAQWFHTWFLAMVAQWLGRDRRYGNALVPLLVSAQGMHKSAFCRSLLPPELRKWGYTDNLSLAEERPVHLAMSQMLLINLDEFNRISPQKQQGFLKNIVQLPSVKVKRPYAAHTEDVPRLASFIATTNMTDALTDPSGSRRFIGVPVTGDINVSQTPNYSQLYAQAQAELSQGARYWFDDDATRAIMRHNQQFRCQTSAEQFFHEFFEAAEVNDPEGSWMGPAAILMGIKQQAGASFRMPADSTFGRILNGTPNLPHKRTNKGSVFYVKPRF